MNILSGRKLVFIGLAVVLLFAIPLTVYLVQRQQETRSAAAPSTTLSFTTNTSSVNVGQTVNLDINMDPGTNQVSFVKLVITYDQTKFSEPNITRDQNIFPSILEGPTYSPAGTASITLSVGADPTKVIQTATKIATLSLKATAPTGSSGTKIDWGTDTQALSIASSDQANENVLSSKNPITITIGGDAGSSGGSSGGGNAPSCSALNIDRAASGQAPYSLTFTAVGNAPNGTINSVNFNFGDGQTIDVTQGGGIGTNSVNVQIAHTYTNPGTFNATATLKDNNGNTSSSSASCTKTITVTSSGGGGGGSTGGGSQGGTGSGSAIVTPTATITAVPTVEALAPTGPGNQFIFWGIGGTIISAVGIALFLLL